MVSSMTRKMISLAISLLVVVISLTGAALAASPPSVAFLTRYNPGFSGAPGKMVRDEANNFYVTDFWGKQIVKTDRLGGNSVFIPTKGRPSAVAVMPDSRLVVALQAPRAYIAFYSQDGTELSQFETPASPLYRPSAIAIDPSGYIYVVDAGDSSTSSTVNVGRVRVYSSAGAYLYAFGSRTTPITDPLSATSSQFKQPMGIAYEKESTNIVIADTMNQRLLFFTKYNGSSCTFVKSIGDPAGINVGTPVDDNTTVVRFGDPADIAFEYAGTALNRIYVAERGRGDIVAVDPVTGFSLSRINGTSVTNADMKFPSGIIFEKTATGGVLYASNAATASPANIIALGIDSGTVPNPGFDLSIASVPYTVGTTPIAISGTVASGLSVTCTANGINSTTYSSGGTNWSMNLPLSSAANVITCSASNGTATKYVQANTYYTVSLGTAPTLQITSPSSGSFTKNSSVTLSGTSNSAGVNIAIAGSTCSPTDASKRWSCSVALAEGSNTITVNASKPGTNSSTAAVTVIRDSFAPGMVVSALSNSANTNIAVQNIDGIITEPNFASVEVNGFVVPDASKVTIGSNTYFSVPVTLVRGANEITVLATDRAGNFVSESRTVTFKPEAPGFSVGLPADNSFEPNISSITANGNIDSGFDTVAATGINVSNPVATWGGDLTVAPGFGTYEFTASGVSNATVKVKRTILNGSYDQLAITNPPADMATSSQTILVSGKVAASSPDLTISVDGGLTVTVTPNQTTGEFSNMVDLGSEGSHSIKVTTAGGTSAIRNIIYDNNSPIVGIQADSRSMPATISGSVEGSAKITATASLNSVAVDIPSSLFSFSPYNSATNTFIWHVDLSAKAYDTISFTATDPSGNSKNRTRSMVLPKGDVDLDGTVRLSDALATLRHSAGTETLVGGAFEQADVGSLIDGRVSSDGNVNVIDATLILKKSYGLLNF